jgi:hypothetical protein
MAVSILAIKFNHNTNAATHDALNIRIDASSTVNVPEWTGGETVASQSPAAYAIKAVGKNSITVEARFKTDTPVKFMEVRAVFVTNAGASKTPLGDLAPAQVVFQADGLSGFVSFQCLSGLGTTVRAKNIQWKWQFRTTAGGAWTDFATTRHRIYVLLNVPTAPWQQTPFNAANLQLPWTDVLDIACVWAAQASTLDGAAGLITDHVYALGPGTVQYDCPGFGSTHYTIGGMFNCTAFVDRVNGGAGNGMFVNCTDCSTFTSTCANILGCDLWQSRIEANFELNEILAIGSSVWQTACGWGKFVFHEAAWKNLCTAVDPLFDACLQIDADPDPTGGAPHFPMLAKNMVFGLNGAELYRDRLCSVIGRPKCNPAPATRKRRPVF